LGKDLELIRTNEVKSMRLLSTVSHGAVAAGITALVVGAGYAAAPPPPTPPPPPPPIDITVPPLPPPPPGPALPSVIYG
jgi:hypothetical protein